jgi:hypothetical protein
MSMKDRPQKQMALKLSVANRWFPQLEVDVQPPRALAQKVPLVTDLDADDAAESCRKLLACLRSIQPELDPSKSEHVAIFFDCCALFSRMLAIVVCHVFKAYLHPKNQTDLAEALLILLYGGRESYQHRNELFKLVKARHTDQAVPELALPEWDRFVQLVRQCLDAPFEVQHSPLILREIGFTALSGNNSFDFARVLCNESPQAARFAILIASYLARSVRLPHEFEAICDANLVPLIPAP